MRQIEHQYTEKGHYEPRGERHCHVFVRDIMYTQLVQDVFGYIGPKLVAQIADCRENPHEEPIELSRSDSSLFSARAYIVDLLLSLVIIILPIAEICLRQVNR